jgi:hypothetical protein
MRLLCVYALVVTLVCDLCLVKALWRAPAAATRLRPIQRPTATNPQDGGTSLLQASAQRFTGADNTTGPSVPRRSLFLSKVLSKRKDTLPKAAVPRVTATATATSAKKATAAIEKRRKDTDIPAAVADENDGDDDDDDDIIEIGESDLRLKWAKMGRNPNQFSESAALMALMDEDDDDNDDDDGGDGDYDDDEGRGGVLIPFDSPLLAKDKMDGSSSSAAADKVDTTIPPGRSVGIDLGQ